MTKKKPSRKIAIVSMRVDVIESYGEVRDALDQNLFRWLTAAGFIPFPVPNTLVKSGQLSSWIDTVQPNLIVLSGGNNIGDFTHRDQTETDLLDFASAHKVPLLGICRGMQMIAHWAGEDLLPVNGHVRERHYLNSGIKSIKLPSSVNSYHDFGLKNCPTGFDIIARSDDGFIEAITHKELPMEGWMWHPEREDHFAEEDIKNVQRLVNKISK